MKITAKSPVSLDFSRSGGSQIISRIDIWKPSESSWESVGGVHFGDGLSKTEKQQLTLPKGSYTCVFQCYVEESLNGKYEFVLKVDGKKVYADKGDVNTTQASNDRKIYKDQFIIEVKE